MMNITQQLSGTFRVSIYSSDRTRISLSRKSFTKPNLRQSEKASEILQREEDKETIEKEITPVENSMNISTMETSEIGM